MLVVFSIKILNRFPIVGVCVRKFVSSYKPESYRVIELIENEFYNGMELVILVSRQDLFGTFRHTRSYSYIQGLGTSS